MDYTALLNSSHGSYLVSIVGFCIFMAAMATVVPLLSKSGCKEVGEHIRDMKDSFKEDFKDLKESLREDSKDMRESIREISKSFEKLVDSNSITNEKIVESLTNIRIDVAANTAATDAQSLKNTVHRFKRPKSTGQQ